MSLQVVPRKTGVEKTLTLDRSLATAQDSLTHDCGGFTVLVPEEFVHPRTADEDAHIEAVEEGATETAPIFRQCRLIAFARFWSASATRTRVGRPNQDEPSRESCASVRTSDPHHTFFEGLTQSVQCRRRELPQFIEKQHATVSQADFSWSHRRRATTDDRHRRRGVMGHAQRRFSHET
jgi:hypothetical protein